MAQDIEIVLENRVGALAELGEAMGAAGVNLSGGCATVVGDQGTIHLLVEDDPDAAREVLDEEGVEVASEREVLVVSVEDEPGALGALARRLADATVDIELMYLATDTRIALGVDDLEAARVALAG